MRLPRLNKRTQTSLRSPLLWMGVVAAILYCSWPLGFILNPAVAQHALSSQLEASGQPYNWLFISLDILSGLAILIGGFWQWRRDKGMLIRLAILGYMLFAILVIVAAAVPFDCNTLTNSCINLTHSPLLIIHGAASTISIIALLASLVLVFRSLAALPSNTKFKLTFVSVFIAWGLVGISALLVGAHRRADETMVQDIFTAICSLSLILAIYVVEYGSLGTKQTVNIQESLL